MERYLGEVLIDERQYESLEELTETELEALDFSELVSVTDEELEHYHNKAEEHPALLPLDAATEYNTLKEQHPDALVGFEQNGYYEFYGEDARKVCELLGGKLLEKETALGTVPVTGFPSNQRVYRAKQLWQRGENVYLAGLNEDGTHHQTKYLRREDYLPLGATVHMEGRAFRVDTVNFDKDSVTLQDVALAEMRMPVFREEPLALVRELYEQEQEVMEHPLPDYKVGDNVIVDLPTRTIEGTIGYVGETDVRIDTSAQGQSWDNEVINKQQFEEGLRQNEPNSTRPVRTEKTVAVYPAKENNLPFDIVIQTISTESPTVEAERPTLELAGNFRITDDHLGEGGAKQKYARNIEAIRTLFKLEEEHRGATAEEQQVLSQYVGWGGLADAFDPGKDSWAKEYAELKGLLSEDEYVAARSSTLNAHYTSPTVIRSIYDAVERMGFRSGNILEPSMGVGNFFGMLPDSMADSRLYGVELDSITGRIAKMLYPQADITVAGFETTDRRDFYDLAVATCPSATTRSTIRRTTSWDLVSTIISLRKPSTKCVRAASLPLSHLATPWTARIAPLANTWLSVPICWGPFVCPTTLSVPTLVRMLSATLFSCKNVTVPSTMSRTGCSWAKPRMALPSTSISQTIRRWFWAYSPPKAPSTDGRT